MFGNFGQLAGLLKNLPQIKENMKNAHERLNAARFQGEAGGGQVRAVVDGKGEPVSLKIESSLLSTQDAEMIEDLTIAAFRNAIRISREGAMKEMQAAAGGMDLGGFADMLK